MTMKSNRPLPAFRILEIVRDLLLGGRFCRHTVARQFNVSLPTADRWLVAIETHIPGAKRVRVGKIAWVEIRASYWRLPGREL